MLILRQAVQINNANKRKGSVQMNIFCIDNKEIPYELLIKDKRPFAYLYKFTPNRYYNIIISKDIFPTAAVNALKKAGCETICDLLCYSPKRLIDLRNVGKGSFIKTVSALVTYCLNNEGDVNYSLQKGDIRGFYMQKMILAERITKLRKNWRQTRQEFADTCGISLGTVQRLEKGTADPKLSTLKKISLFAGCSVSDLLSKMN